MTLPASPRPASPAPELLRRNPNGSAPPLHLAHENTVTACNSVAYVPAAQLAAVAAPMLEGLRQQYLAGASGQEMLAPVVRGRSHPTGHARRGVAAA